MEEIDMKNEFIVKDELQKEAFVDSERIWTVYVHIVPKDVRSAPDRDDYYDKYYVGITSISTERRWRKNGDGYKTQRRFAAAINKYGWNNIIHEIIANKLTQKEAIHMEKTLIKELDAFGKHGYNGTLGGEELGIYKNIIGMKYGHLTVLYKDETRNGDYWICECDCAAHNKVSRLKYSLTSDRDHMCDDCFKKMIANNNKKQSKYTHVQKDEHIYYLWIDMKKRSKQKSLKIYESWNNDFLEFQNWCLNNNYEKGKCFTRIDETKGFYPDNCEFIDKNQLSKKQIGKNGKFFTYNNLTMNMKQWAAYLNIPYNVFKARVSKMPFDKAVNLPYKQNKKERNDVYE